MLSRKNHRPSPALLIRSFSSLLLFLSVLVIYSSLFDHTCSLNDRSKNDIPVLFEVFFPCDCIGSFCQVFSIVESICLSIDSQDFMEFQPIFSFVDKIFHCRRLPVKSTRVILQSRFSFHPFDHEDELFCVDIVFFRSLIFSFLLFLYCDEDEAIFRVCSRSRSVQVQCLAHRLRFQTVHQVFVQSSIPSYVKQIVPTKPKISVSTFELLGSHISLHRTPPLF